MSKKYFVYVGTYTHGKSQGIYAYELDIASGKLESIGLAAEIDNPSYLIINHNKTHLYAVLETDSYNGIYGGAVVSFAINPSTGALTFMNSQSTKGIAPCHLCTDSENKFLFAANYMEGTLTAFPLNADGSIAPASAVIAHEGTGPNAERQEKPHVHNVTFTPDEKNLCVVDLGIDKVMIYDVNHETGSLTPAKNPYVKIIPGSGPRHILFHPSSSFAYVINELTSNVVALSYNPTDCSFSPVQYISALPTGYTGPHSGAAIHITPDGNYLYVSNRFHDSIAGFRINKISGGLQLISHTSTLGCVPRDFIIDPTGKYLFTVNQESDSLVTFEINQETGELNQLHEVIEVPNPVCIKILSLEV